MKKSIYVICFVALGLISQQIIHTAVETWYIGLLVNDFDQYSLGLDWNQWLTIHNFMSAILIVLGAVFGLWQGLGWWPKLYDKNGKVRYPKPWRI